MQQVHESRLSTPQIGLAEENQKPVLGMLNKIANAHACRICIASMPTLNRGFASHIQFQAASPKVLHRKRFDKMDAFGLASIS
mmetsp:Transcript_18856/g.27259  ORF Transcript_18856/g.27259 Transcript_18856/m.27259 type:complete len:83 (+) Transcript_18856:1676-1924(+)